MIIAETERLLLRRVLPDDAAAWQAIFCDPAVMRFGGARTPEWVRGAITDMIERYYDEWGYGRWSAVAKTTRAVVGVVGLAHYRDRCLEPDEAEIGYRFAPACWGRGYATEAAFAACAAGFRVSNVTHIIAYIDPANVGSVRVAHKLGFQFDRPVQLPGQDPEHRYVLDRRSRHRV